MSQISSSYTIEEAIASALSMAESSFDRGCLFKNSEIPGEDDWDDENGDAETLSSIASLVLCESVDGLSDSEVESIVMDKLREVYPDYDD